MKKIISVGIVICLLIAVYFPIAKVFALSEKEEETFFEISETEATIGETLEMTINLSEIDYDNFIFTLQANVDVESIEIEKTVNTNITTEYSKEDAGIIIQIDKTVINLDTITLYYQVPDTLEIGDKIEFTATVVNNEEEEKTNTTNSLTTNTSNTTNSVNSTNSTNTVTNTSNIAASEEEEMSITIEVKIVEETKTSTQEETVQEDNKEQTTNFVNEISSTSQGEIIETSSTSQKTTETTSSMTSVSTSTTMSSTSTTMTTTETVTYNGSDNNYLEELSVSGYEFTKSFSKENTTYFITVSEDVEKLTINAEAEDDDATVCIYGNDSLTKDTNKILINVTAENGNIRTYRIIVTKG